MCGHSARARGPCCSWSSFGSSHSPHRVILYYHDIRFQLSSNWPNTTELRMGPTRRDKAQPSGKKRVGCKDAMLSSRGSSPTPSRTYLPVILKLLKEAARCGLHIEIEDIVMVMVNRRFQSSHKGGGAVRAWDSQIRRILHGSSGCTSEIRELWRRCDHRGRGESKAGISSSSRQLETDATKTCISYLSELHILALL